MKGYVWAAAVALAGLPLMGQNPAAGRRPMTFGDMMQMRRLGDIDLSPDGRWVLFSATDVDVERNTRTPHLWIVPAGGGAERPLTASMAGESHGRFSPDGKRILFESSRGEGQQIWLADFDTATGTIGEPRPLTHISTEADGAMWSPDGAHIAFVSSVWPECSAADRSGADEDACDRQKQEARDESKVRAQIFTHLLYRHWNAFTGERRSHLFLVSVADGSFRDLNPGDTHDVPPFSLGEPDGYAFSPDGKEMAFEEKPVEDPELSTSISIFTLNLVNGAAPPVKISTSAGGNFTPRYSPDGKFLAWRMQERAGYESDRFRLVLYDRASRRTTPMLPRFDRWVDDLAWGPGSRRIYFTAGDAGEEPIYAVSVTEEKPDAVPARLTDAGSWGDLHPASDGKALVATRMTVSAPAEVFALGSGEGGAAVLSGELDAAADTGAHREVLKAAQLSHLNDELLVQLDLPAMESFWFPSIGHVRVEGFVIRPPGFVEGRKYPVKFLIHGGPQGAWGDDWSYRWNAELLAANGYVVVMINPRGSTGYGQAFVDGVNGDWGGRPYFDLMRGLDYAEQHYGFIDRGRECALGASYGGYMADWILGHTNRFRCIVSHDGMFDPVSAWGTTDELWFNEWEFRGTPWSAHSVYRRWSPMLAETRFRTPTLVIHGQLDYRLDVSQGYQLFDTLQRMKIPSEMLYFPDEGHWVQKPQNSALWYKTVDAWVDRWTQPQ